MKIPGVYVEIKGDATQLKKEMAQAKEYIASQATGISNSLNNALSSSKISSSVNGIVQQLGTLNRAMKVDPSAFGTARVDLKDLTKLTGLSEQQFGKLQSRMMQTQAANAQESALRRIASACNLTEKEVRELGAQFKMSAAQIEGVVGSSNRASVAISTLANFARGLTAFLSVQQIAQFGMEVLNTGIKVDALNRSMVAIYGSSAAAASEMSFLRSTADSTGQDMYKLAEGYKQLSAATMETELEGKKTKDIFLAVSEAAAVLGLSQDRVSASITALSQMASKGTVQMEELKGQLGDHIPGAVQIAARAMGVSTEKLMEMAKEGKLLASDVLPAMARELHNLYGEAAQTAALESGQAAVNRLSQAWTEFKDNLYNNEAAVFAINTITAALENAKMGMVGFTVEGIQAYQEGIASINTESEVKIPLLEPTGTKKQITSSADLEDGRKKLLSYIQTREQKIQQDYDEAVKFAQSSEEIAAAAKVRDEALNNLNKKNASSGLKAERSALKELNAEITGYTAEAREAGNAALAWNRDAQDSLEAIQKLNNELGTSGMSDFGKMAYDSAQLVKQGTKDVEAYQLAVSEAGNQITITGAAYDKANAQLNKAKAALAANGAGSDTQDANKVRALEKEVVELDAQLREHTQIYYDLTEAQKSNIKKVEELQAAANETLAFDTAMAGYQKLGLITSEFYAKLEQQEEQRRKDFVANGGDPWIAEQLKYAANLNDRTALASTEYQQSGSLGGLMGTGLENYKISVDQDAITFYSDLLPDAIGESTDAMAEFFRDIAQGNASLSNSWKSLGESVENTVYDILQDLLALQLKMVVLGSLGVNGSGAATGGGLVGMLTGLFSANATGNVYSAPALSAYSNSVVSRPTVFPFAKGIGLMGEAGSEAIMPLTRTSGGKLGVQADMSGVGASAPNINVTINNNSSAQATATVQQSNDGLSYDVIVEMVEQKMQDRVNRGRQAVGKRAAYL